jgi:hypothetical protein
MEWLVLPQDKSVNPEACVIDFCGVNACGAEFCFINL